MHLSAVLPPRRNKERPVDLPEMLVNCLLAACQHKEFKRLVGWKGMAVSARGKQGWTMKVRSRPGVFGLCLEDTLRHGQGHHASLGLYYFPDEQEPLLDIMSLAASYAATQEDYTERLRHFTTDEPWARPFRMGTLSVSLGRDEDLFALRLQAVERKLSIATDGVAMQSGEWVILPGEAEEDFPAHDIAMDLVLVLAAAVSNSLGEPPYQVDRIEETGHGVSYTASGSQTALGLEITVLTDFFRWGDEQALDPLDPLGRPPVRGSVSGGPDDRDGLPAPLDTALFWETHDLAALSQIKAYAPAFDSRPSFIVLSGFLGSGKTTFLNQLLEYHASRDELVAIIQNEIGQTGVDGRLLEGDDAIVELDEGCVCCTLAGNLSKGIEQLRARFNPKVIVLESTGLANPFNILHELETLRPLVRLDSVTTLVDAENGPGLLAAYDIARDQVRAADTILLNKCDLVSVSERESLQGLIHKLNGRAMVVETEFGAVNPGFLYDADPFAQPPAGLLPSLPDRTHHTHAMEGFTSRRFAFGAAVSRKQLQLALAGLPEAVFRVKGIVRIVESNEPEVVQYVSGRYELSPLGDVFDDEGFLVAIGRDMELSALEKLERMYA